MISTRNLNDLPSIDTLMVRLQSLASLDSILSPEWEGRYYSFNSNWDKDTSLASLRNGSGNHLFIIFDSYGCFIKGFDHESPINSFNLEQPSTWKGVFDAVPPHFKTYFQEVSLIPDETSFCIWRSYSDISWNVGGINFSDGDELDRSKDLLSFLVISPQEFQKWVKEYYGVSVELELFIHIFLHKPLTPDMIHILNPHVSIEEVNKDLHEIGYI